jgi:RNase adaptor protein for sRNA GlmZ degradation
MTCGPDVVVERVDGAVLRCPSCGDEQRIPALPLFVVTGASGTGKSTVMEPLRARLPDVEVFDVDVTLQVAAIGWDVWRDTWLRLVHAVALNGRVCVLCGSLTPDQLETLPARKLIGSIHFCLLDCPDETLADRLRSRPPWRDSSSDAMIAQHQRFAAWLRANIRPCLDTNELTPDQTADRIASWISGTRASRP